MNRFLFVLGFLLIFMAPRISAMEIEGVKVEETVIVGNTPLRLNGAGVGYKAIFKVYVGALYTTKKVSTYDEVVTTSGPKRVSLIFVRNIESGALIRILSQSIQDNVQKNEMSKFVPGLIRIGEMFSTNKSLAVGDVVTVDWIPNVGTVIHVRGKPQGEAIKDPDFFRALIAVWVGNIPAEFQLKDSLLGLR